MRLRRSLPKLNRRLAAVVSITCLCNAIQLVSAQTWVKTSAPTNTWQSVASSADGEVLAAAAGNGGVFISTNSGNVWFQANLPATNYYSGIASSADGSRL